jgi:glycosyltransferase involved in cell wall biosynthesis
MPDPGPGRAKERDPRAIRSVALISSTAITITNFRGPLIEAMVAAGVRVHALAPDYDDRSRQAVAALGAEPVDFSLERTGMRPGRDLLDAMRLARVLRRLRPDATFAYFIKPVIYGSLAARLARVPRRFALVAGLGYVFTSSGEPSSLKRRGLRAIVSSLYALAFRACERVFFQNGDDIAQFVGAGLVSKDRVTLLNGSGVDLDRLSVAPLPPGPPVFLLMARLLREKGIVEYAEAARIIHRTWPDIRFLLVGGTDPNPGGLSASQVEGWVREGAIEWPGHVDDVGPWLERSSVYVLPSYREGKPRSTQEAMARGRAVITTDAPGCRDTVDEGVNGFLVPVRDVDALAAAMRRFIEDPSLIARMGRDSRRLAEERFDVHRINAQILGTMGIAGPAPANPSPTARG